MGGLSRVKELPSKEEEALQLALRTKAKILGATYNPIAVLRSCYTIAESMGLNEDLAWLALELNGYPDAIGQNILQVPPYRIIHLRSTFNSYPYPLREGVQQLTGLVKRRISTTVNWNYGNYTLKPTQFESIVEHVINRCLLFLNRVTTEL